MGVRKPVFKNAKVKSHGSYNYAQSSIYLHMAELKDVQKFSEKLVKVISSLNADAEIEANFELNMGNLYGNPESPKKVNQHPNHSMNTAHNESIGLLHFLKEIPLLYPDRDAETGKLMPLLTPQLRVLQAELPKGVIPDECVKGQISKQQRQTCTDNVMAAVNKFGTEFHNGTRKVLHDTFPGTGSYGSLSDYDLKNGLSKEIDWKHWIWGDNYARLLSIKKKVDPNNTLTCHHCVGAEFPRNKPFPSDSLLI